MIRHAVFLFILAISLNLHSAELPNSLSAQDILSEKSVTVSAGKKGMVVVFLSAACPCSNSHVEEIKKLSEEFKDFNFVGVHSNQNESFESSQPYFKNAALPFVVLEDKGAKIAEKFGASKTPHAFVVLNDGKAAYRGGVSSSSVITNADRFYLREALSDLKNGKSVRTPEGRTLGCYIDRGG